MSESKGSGSRATKASAPRVGVTSQGGPSNVEGAAQPAGSADTGPGTGTPSPTDTQARTPDRQLSRRVGAAPLEAADAEGQTLPEEGVAWRSTNPVADLVGVTPHSVPGETHGRLVDEDGDDVDAEDVFEDADPDLTYRVVAQRVHEEFYYGGSDQPMRRLLFAAGQRVPVAKAVALTNALRLAEQQREQELESNPAR